MFLIMSGAYVGIELESEFGKLPPSFLPLGNKRLFQHQVALAPRGTDIYLSLPDSFELSAIDRKWLSDQNVKVLAIPEKLTLGASLVAALNVSGHSLDKPLHVLYGDTLYRNLPLGENIVSVSKAEGSYNWAVLGNSTKKWLLHDGNDDISTSKKVISGYFKFSNPRELIKCITQTDWDIIEGLNLYHNAIALSVVESNDWLDFGHVNTYYHSKTRFTTQRAFNELTINSNWIEKSSSKDAKIAAEANWFNAIPPKLRINTPQYLGSNFENGKTSYRLEYLHLTALNELFVFSKLPSHVWEKIILSCLEFISNCKKHPAPDSNSANSLDALFIQKSEQRLGEYCSSMKITFDDRWIFNDSEPLSIRDLLCESEKFLPTEKSLETVLHGDFCFSNILYDFRAGKIKTIDPRGMTPEGVQTIYGDVRYDLAKLSHSILGLYDWIIAGYYHVEISNNRISFDITEDTQNSAMQELFINMVEKQFNLSSKNLYAMQIQLFLSMLPLHSDNPMRQKALFANAFRLYHILIRL
ncbi:capsular biosynthesis protein [Enterovibrio norvegicus]|uniref:Capsular biosynthesis protein n=1 Tax=Enterovibrio norvegicus DSM 15893 TaxID=1121869 RepID=A0A1I5S7Q0_9GAMM|nr:capsular biosynthesis protein [Enterovibrio norvegicus]SFP66617.1 hypothetical protein SAMN03084138_02808 [Enterovibrio norvegicus DSM 15893]